MLDRQSAALDRRDAGARALEERREESLVVGPVLGEQDPQAQKARLSPRLGRVAWDGPTPMSVLQSVERFNVDVERER